MDADQFAHFLRRGRAGIGGCLHSTHITPNHHSNQAAADLLLTYQLHIGRLNHGIGCLNSTYQALRFDHTKRICVHNHFPFRYFQVSV